MPYASCRITASPQPPAWNMPAIVAGNARMDEAKMTGMTPPVFTFSGMCVLDPPYIRRPTTRLAYCTGIRRCARSKYTMTPMTPTMMAAIATSATKLIILSVKSVTVCWTAWGSRATMPA